MPVSEKIGGLPGLSFIWDHGPWSAAAIMLIADFGIICALMWAEGIPPNERSLYKTFVWNDTIFIPLYCAMVVFILEDAPKLEGFYTQPWWHVTLLVLGFVISIAFEVGAVRVGQYTMSQELSPAKLWHTFIYGIVFYWLVSSLIPILAVHQPVWALAVVWLAFVGFATTTYLDAVLPFPKDAHLEGTYIPWEWHRRKY